MLNNDGGALLSLIPRNRLGDQLNLALQLERFLEND